MNVNGKPKKGRGLPTRASRGRMNERQPSYDGAFGNHRLLQTMGSMVGFTMQVHTKNKESYEGVFTSMSSKFEVVLEYPHIIAGPDPSIIINPTLAKKKIIFAKDDIVAMKICAVDLDYANRDNFAIDSAISGRQNGQLKGRTLEPWENDDDDQGVKLEDTTDENGWNAELMFEKNAELCSQQSTYSIDMVGYTTPLPKRDTKEWKEQEVQAQKIAHEIENSTTTQARAELENGQNEEDRFSAVSRSESNKYIPPKRKMFASGIKLPPRAPQGSSSYRYNTNSPPRGSGNYTGGQGYTQSHHRQEPPRNPPAQPPLESNSSTDYKLRDKEDTHLQQAQQEYAAKQMHNYNEPPKEQRRKYHKEDPISDLKKFGKSFNITDTPGDKNVATSTATTPKPSSRPVAAPVQQPEPVSQISHHKPQANHHKPPEVVDSQEEAPPQPKPIVPLEEKPEEKKTPPMKSSALNPDAKPFTPRSAATPPPAQTQHMVAGNHHPQMITPSALNFQPNILSAAYIMPQIPLSAPSRGIPKRGAILGHQRAEYSSQMQVANATGTPLLTGTPQGPMTNIPSTVQLSPGMMQQNPQFPHYPFLMRYPTPVPTATMLTTMMPTSAVYPQADLGQGPHLHGQQMFVSPSVLHHPATQLSAQHPPQSHTPQNHNPGPLSGHNMQPTQGQTPVPSPSQTGVCGGPLGGVGGQTVAGHLPPHGGHPTQSQHSSQCGGHGTVGGPPQALLMFPQGMQSPHMLAQATNSPHSGAGQNPVSLPQYPTNNVVHFNHGPPVNYLQGAHANSVLPIHHNQ